MEGKKQSFFKELRKIAANMDRGTKLCKNPEMDYFNRAKCLNSLKGYTEEVQEKLDKSKEIYQEQEHSLVKFQSILDLVEEVIDQQKEILQSQETYMEQYGYVPYEKTCSKTEEKSEGAQEPECVSSPKENTSPSEEQSEEVPTDGEFPRMPRIEDLTLSHYTMLELQRRKISNRPTIERIATPTAFQHNGLFMSPSVCGGRMPPLYTPDVKNSTQETIGWRESVVSASKSAFLLSSAKKSHRNLQMEMNNEDADILNRCPNAISLNFHNSQNFNMDNFLLTSAKKIRKNLQKEMNNEDPDILNRCPSAPSLSFYNSQNFNLDIYQLPPTPKLFSKMATPKHAEKIVSKPKDYLNEEIPQPPKKFQTCNRKAELDTFSSPLFQSSTSSSDTLDTPNATNNPIRSFNLKREDQLSYFDMDIPEPPVLRGVYNIQPCHTKPDTDTPSPPLLHSILTNLDPADSPNITAKQVLSCKSKKNKQMTYLEMDVPEAPKLSGVYSFSTRNKENQTAKS